MEEDCSSDVREAAECGGGCGGGEAVAEDDGVRLSAVGDDLGGEEFMEDGCGSGRDLKYWDSTLCGTWWYKILREEELSGRQAYLALPRPSSEGPRGPVEGAADAVVAHRAATAAAGRAGRRGPRGGSGGSCGGGGDLLLLVLQRDGVPLDELPDLVLRPRPLVLVLSVRQVLQEELRGWKEA